MAQEAIRSLEEEGTASLVGFIEMHFDILVRSRKSLRAKYDLLRSFELDVGTFQSFKTTYYLVKKRRTGMEKKASPEETGQYEPAVRREASKMKNPQQREMPDLSVSHTGLRPVLLPDGTPVEIDPETGAKKFKI